MKGFPLHHEFDVWIIYFAVLTGGLSASRVKAIVRRLGLSRRQEEKIGDCRKVDRMLIKSLRERRILPSRVFALLKPLSCEAVILLFASSRNSTVRKHVLDFLKVYNGVRLCISGEDLRKLGALPGPGYQKILSRVLAARLNGRVKSRDDEFSLAEKILDTDNKGV